MPLEYLAIDCTIIAIGIYKSMHACMDRDAMPQYYTFV